MTYTSRLGVLALGSILLVCALLSACDSQVYTDDELEAQERFSRIKAGAAEQEVRASLGAPSGIATHSGPDQLSFESGEGGSERGVLLDANDRSKWPTDLEFLPKRPVSGKVLMYTDGTVTAYYFLSPDGRVEYVDLFTS